MDYRNTDQCPTLSDLDSKKRGFESKIRDEHKKAKIMYNFVKEKKGNYFREFAKIYNNKCAYCGASMKFIDRRLFEIDHFICASSFPKTTEGRTEAGQVSNLIFSCYSCNRGKSDLHLEEDYQVLLNPDDNSIANVFYRDDNYYIKICDNYANNELIQKFHAELSLGNESRRLDYLLLEMDNLIDQLSNDNKKLAAELGSCMNKLLQKKNCSNF